MAVHSYYLVALSVAVAFVIRKFVVVWQKRSLGLTLARQRGWYPIVKYPSQEFYGRDYDREHKQAWADGRINEFARERYEVCKTSTFEVDTLDERVIFTSDALNHQIIASNSDWVKEDRNASHPFFGESILTLNGQGWKETRDLVTPLFKYAELKAIEHFDKFVDRVLDLIPHDGSTIDMQPLMRKLFLDTSTEFIFGETIDSLRDPTDSSQVFIDTFNRAATGAGKRYFPTGLRSFLRSYIGEWDSTWLSDCAVIHSYIDTRIVQQRIKEKSSPSSPSSSSPHQQRYFLIDGMSPSIQDPLTLRFHLLGIFSIARETAPMAATNVLFALARNPKMWGQLRAEALDLMPIEERGEKEETRLTYDQLNSLTSFRHTVMEALRLYSPVTRNRAVAAVDTSLPRGGGPDGMGRVYVPQGSIVFVDKYPLFVDPAIWGEDAREFRPSRFENRTVGWEFAPFSGGSRMCPANQQVMLQCMYLLFRLVREFEGIENRDECEEYIEGVHFCFYSRNGCKVALIP